MVCAHPLNQDPLILQGQLACPGRGVLVAGLFFPGQSLSWESWCEMGSPGNLHPRGLPPTSPSSFAKTSNNKKSPSWLWFSPILL